MLRIATFALRGFLVSHAASPSILVNLVLIILTGSQLLFGAVVLGVSVTVAKHQAIGMPPSETSFGSFCGAFGILISLIGFGALFFDKIPALVLMAADGLATAFYLAGAIVSRNLLSAII